MSLMYKSQNRTRSGFIIIRSSCGSGRVGVFGESGTPQCGTPYSPHATLPTMPSPSITGEGMNEGSYDSFLLHDSLGVDRHHDVGYRWLGWCLFRTGSTYDYSPTISFWEGNQTNSTLAPPPLAR